MNYYRSKSNYYELLSLKKVTIMNYYLKKVTVMNYYLKKSNYYELLS